MTDLYAGRGIYAVALLHPAGDVRPQRQTALFDLASSLKNWFTAF
jgi:hypothetical protein